MDVIARVASASESPVALDPDLSLHWHMTRGEKYGVLHLLELADAATSIEVGTGRGGATKLVASRSEQVYSIDVDASSVTALDGRFENVTFMSGDSREILPKLLKDIERRGEDLGFVLIDGDDTAEGVKGDITALLQHRPTRPVYIVFHDSFVPAVRQGILEANWRGCPYVHYVEVDFIQGTFHPDPPAARDTPTFGGLALAVMQPEPRFGRLSVLQSHREFFEAGQRRSGRGRLLARARNAGLAAYARIASRQD